MDLLRRVLSIIRYCDSHCRIAGMRSSADRRLQLSLAALLHRPCARHRSAEWVAARQAQEEAGGAVPGGCTMAVGSCTAQRRVASLMRATQSFPHDVAITEETSEGADISSH